MLRKLGTVLLFTCVTSLANTLGFVYSSGSGFSTFSYPGARDTLARGINDNGPVVGYVLNGDGFLYSGGTFSIISVPGTPFGYTHPFGINASGTIVGVSRPAPFYVPVGFVDSGETFTTIDVAGGGTTIDYPGALYTNLSGINANGAIVGVYEKSPDFIFTTSFTAAESSVPSTLRAPLSTPAAARVVTGINDDGVIVGSYETSSGGPSHGYCSTAREAEVCLYSFLKIWLCL